MKPDRVRPLHPGRPAPAAILLAFFLPAIVFLLCAAVVTAAGTAAGYDHTRWLALHLFLVGGVSGLILGAAPFFTGAFLATGPAPRLVRHTQLLSWNAGAVLVPIGVLRQLDPVTAVGACCCWSGSPPLPCRCVHRCAGRCAGTLGRRTGI